jgi:hypothetical protein
MSAEPMVLLQKRVYCSLNGFIEEEHVSGKSRRFSQRVFDIIPIVLQNSQKQYEELRVRVRCLLKSL